MFLPDSDTMQALADALQKGSANDLASHWRGINRRSHAWAYNTIYSALTARGFTAAQIAAWDRGGEFESDLSTFKSLQTGGALQTADDRFIQGLNRTKDLLTVTVTNGGVFQSAAPGNPGTVSGGNPDTSGDAFVFPELEGGGRRDGRPTRW